MFSGNPGHVQVTPREVDVRPITERRQVRLYFIGTHTLRDGAPPIVTVGQRVIQMPPIGESIIVDELMAKEITHRLDWYEANNPAPIPGVTTSAEIAAAVKAAYDRGDDKLDLRQMVAAESVKSVPVETLMEELKRRGLDVNAIMSAVSGQTELNEGVVNPEDPQLTPAQKAAATRAANKAAAAQKTEE